MLLSNSYSDNGAAGAQLWAFRWERNPELFNLLNSESETVRGAAETQLWACSVDEKHAQFNFLKRKSKSWQQNRRGTITNNIEQPQKISFCIMKHLFSLQQRRLSAQMARSPLKAASTVIVSPLFLKLPTPRWRNRYVYSAKFIQSVRLSKKSLRLSSKFVQMSKMIQACSLLCNECHIAKVLHTPISLSDQEMLYNHIKYHDPKKEVPEGVVPYEITEHYMYKTYFIEEI